MTFAETKDELAKQGYKLLKINDTVATGVMVKENEPDVVRLALFDRHIMQGHWFIVSCIEVSDEELQTCLELIA